MTINIAELKVAVNSKIVRLAKAEKVTKQLLGELSRELIEYVFIQKTNDIDSVNRTINACSPVNRKIAVLFFSHFLPFAFDEEADKFAGMQKKRIDNCMKACIDFLASQNTIWEWAEENVQVDTKEPDYLGRVTSAVKKAITHHAVASEVIGAVLAAGLSIDNMMAVLQQAAEQAAQEEKKAA